MYSQLLFFHSLYSLAYGAIGPVANLYILNKNVPPDGFIRSATLASTSQSAQGASVPGPLIVGNKGDTFNINVVNLLSDSSMLMTTSIHWHGIFQAGTNWADGPVGVSQCPIIPGNSYLYQFNVGSQAGTFWYHSHHRTQYCDGLRGPLVVYDQSDPLKYLYDVDDESTVITLSEWYHPSSLAQGVNPNYDSTLINGLGRYIGGPASPLAVINVKQHTRYRFRLVSISCDPDFTFSIDNHTMTIIEADGTLTKPLTVDSIDIIAGQRYSFVLNANQSVDNYWIRSVPGPGPTGFAGGINSAILRYVGAPVTDPSTPVTTSSKPLSESDLVPFQNPASPAELNLVNADIKLNINITFDSTTQQYFLNGGTFTPPTVPVLLQILSGARTAQSLLPSGNVYMLPKNKVVEVSIPGGSADSPHPFHLHGQRFSVIRSAGSSKYNYVNPVTRDVVNTGIAGDNVTFRFTTTNPGPWILHCHIDWHLALGLALVFTTDANSTAKIDPPSAWGQLCPMYNKSGLQ